MCSLFCPVLLCLWVIQELSFPFSQMAVEFICTLWLFTVERRNKVSIYNYLSFSSGDELISFNKYLQSIIWAAPETFLNMKLCLSVSIKKKKKKPFADFPSTAALSSSLLEDTTHGSALKILPNWQRNHKLYLTGDFYPKNKNHGLRYWEVLPT